MEIVDFIITIIIIIFIMAFSGVVCLRITKISLVRMPGAAGYVSTVHNRVIWPETVRLEILVHGPMACLVIAYQMQST